MPVVFKLKFGEETRRVTFPELPSWATLSSRLTALYDIPTTKLGVSYTDPDGDEITLNTEEELLDYYETSNGSHPGEALRLKVVDLTLLRGAIGSTPRVEPLSFDPDDDWQKFPSVQVLSGIDFLRDPSALDIPHSFVEVLSDSGTPTAQPRHLDADDDQESVASTVQGPTVDKGKQRETLSFPSTTSLIDEEPGEKHPIHVLDRSTVIDTTPDPSQLGHSQKPESPRDATIAQNTAPTQTADRNDHVDDDPPLPTIDTNGTSSTDHPSSLTEDVAALLASLNAAVAGNPQLGETFQRIMQNTRSGAYWRDHRDSLRQTVQNMTQAVGTATEELRRNAEAEVARNVAHVDELRRNAEAEAARNISQLLGNLFQALSLPPPTAPEANSEQPASSDAQDQTSPENIEGSPRSVPGAFPHHPHAHHAQRWRGRGRPLRHSWGIPGTFGMPPPITPPPHPGMPGMPPPPPPPPGFNPFGPPPPIFPQTQGWGAFMGFQPPPPPPPASQPAANPPPPPKGPSRFSSSTSSSAHHEAQPPSDKIWDPELRPSWLPPPPQPIEPQSSAERPSPRERLASVTAAKEKYKEEKERYRREKQELRKLREERRASGMTPAVGPSTSLPAVSREPSHEEHREVELPSSPSGLARSNTYLVSHARGPFPQLEMVSASPRRSMTISSGERERRMGTEEKEFQDARVFGRISRRLADMGFTERTHPVLPGKIKAQLPKDSRTVTKAMEDDVVSNLLEDLLSREANPRSPVASGSGIQREQMEVPGGWKQ